MVRQVERAHGLVALSASMHASLDADVTSVLTSASRTVEALLGDVCAVWWRGPAGLELRACTRHGRDALNQARELWDACAQPGGVLDRAVDGDRPVLVESSTAAPLAGLALAPLSAGGRALGALAVARTTDPLLPDDLEDLQHAAQVVASTLSHAVLREEVQRARVHARLLAREDHLTGLLNRRGFVEELHASPGDGSTLVAVLDMDGFRLVNDGFGHVAGDLVLTSVAARLCSAVPGATPVARIGGDEFALLVRAADEAEARAVVARAVEHLSTTLQVAGLTVPVSVTVGTATCDGGDPDAVLQHADLALARAQRSGAVAAHYDPALDDPATRALREVIDLRRAIVGDGLVVHYQPVVSVRPGPLRVEALVRRRQGDALLAPGDWLGTADRAGLMPEVTANVVRQVVAQLQRWWAAGLEVECAVNVPAPVLARPELVAELLAVLDGAGLPRRALSVEVTEGELVGPQAREALRRCAEDEIAVAVDDFGTGWSALSYLVELPLQTLKLDRAFVAGIDSDPRRAAVVRAVVDVAHELGLRVVAEGVETQAVADLVIDLGADALQGYLYSRPSSADQIAPLLRSGLLAARR